MFSYGNFPARDIILTMVNGTPSSPPCLMSSIIEFIPAGWNMRTILPLFRKKLTELTIPYFNDRFLSKWEVHERLVNENHLQPHIPETKIFSKENLADF